MHHAPALALAIAACATPAATATATTTTTTALAPAAATPATVRPPCPAIDGLAAALGPGGMLVLGELHGTQEIPRFIGDVACHAVADGPVTLGLEIPRDEQGRLDAYLASAGDAAARTALLAGGFWRRADQDGRSSVGMTAVLERARALRAVGGDVAVLAFDIAGPSATPRDQAMAQAIAAARRAAPTRTFVVLSGNYHSRRTVGAPWDPAARWMAGYLVDDGVALTTLDIAQAGGDAWVRLGDDDGGQTCGAHAWPGHAVGAPWSIEVVAGVEGHDGRYTVGPTHAAPPAVGATGAVDAARRE